MFFFVDADTDLIFRASHENANQMVCCVRRGAVFSGSASNTASA